MDRLRLILPLAAALLVASRGAAQEAPPPEAFPRAPSAPERAGRFRLGRLWLTPTFRIGTIGLDTNVFYTATDRRTDITASGGPGLAILLPVRSLRLGVDGGLDYVYFLRTASQRRLGGDARARLEWTGGRVRAAAQQSWARSFQRPSFEVDRRVLQDQVTTGAEVALKPLGRLGLRSELSRTRFDVKGDQEYFGTDLRSTLSYDQNRALLGFAVALTPKTSLLLEGDAQSDRFLIDATRDARSNRLYAGFRVDSETRLAGRAVGGVRLFRPLAAPDAGIQAPYASVSLWYHVAPRTHLNAAYDRDLSYSAFETTGATPTLTLETTGLRLEKGLVGRVELYLYVRQTRLRTDGAVTIVSGDGSRRTAPRDDHVREWGADLGYRLRPNLRVGVSASYVRRRSTFADFGIRGLIVGGTVTYNPTRR